MKRSPLSTPCGPPRRRPYNWSPHENANRRGYQSNNDSHQYLPTNEGQQAHGDDFIPLNISTPVMQHKRHSNSWYSPRGGRNNISAGSRGSNYRYNYNATPNRSSNSSFSPYKNSGRQFHGQRKNDKGTHRRVNISEYVDISSFLEDPWENLLRKLNASIDTSKSEKSDIESLSNTESADSSYMKKLESKLPRNTNLLDDSVCSQELKSESSIDVSFGTENTSTDVRNTTKDDSSVDLGIDSICFSQTSPSNSTCSVNDSISRTTEEKNNTASNTSMEEGMADFTNQEKAEMHFMYGAADGNALEAQRLYRERFPTRCVPDRKTFERLHRCLCETGSFDSGMRDTRRTRSVRTPQVVEDTLHRVEDHPESSTRAISCAVNETVTATS